jgi:hypothetical protein
MADLRDWLLEIRTTHGVLTPQLVMEAAKDKDSPAHNYVFNIEEDEAAEQYYLGRAHRLIQTVKVSYQPVATEPPRRVRFFHAVAGDEQPFTYEPLDELLKQPERLEELRRAAKRRLTEAERAVEDFDALMRDARSGQAVALLKRASVLLSTP